MLFPAVRIAARRSPPARHPVFYGPASAPFGCSFMDRLEAGSGEEERYKTPLMAVVVAEVWSGSEAGVLAVHALRQRSAADDRGIAEAYGEPQQIDRQSAAPSSVLARPFRVAAKIAAVAASMVS